MKRRRVSPGALPVLVLAMVSGCTSVNTASRLGKSRVTYTSVEDADTVALRLHSEKTLTEIRTALSAGYEVRSLQVKVIRGVGPGGCQRVSSELAEEAIEEGVRTGVYVCYWAVPRPGEGTEGGYTSGKRDAEYFLGLTAVARSQREANLLQEVALGRVRDCLWRILLARSGKLLDCAPE